MDLEKFGIRKYMVKATEQIKCINKCIFAVSFLFKLLIRKMKFKIINISTRQYYVQENYLLFVSISVHSKYTETIMSIFKVFRTN